MQTVDAIVVAAGMGTRLGGDTPKQFLPLAGQTVLARALAAFAVHPAIRHVVAVIAPGEEARFREAAGPEAAHVAIAYGGKTRQESVANGLRALQADAPDSVLIHDGARPFVSPAVIQAVVDALGAQAAVIPAIPVADTLKRVTNNAVETTVPRDNVMQAQTPQGFAFEALMAAHDAARDAVTDDAGLMEANGYVVHTVAGSRSNFKITTADDLMEAKRLTAYPSVGSGFDVHRLVPGGPLILGGLTLDEPFSLEGHSDADVALHALTDAIFGALADGDIGSHFPPSDMQWKGAASDQFLAFAAERARAAGELAHLDLTIICERPRIGPHREAMRTRIAAITGVPVSAVSVKATTTERLGFTGRGEGIAAQALATVMRA